MFVTSFKFFFLKTRSFHPSPIHISYPTSATLVQFTSASYITQFHTVFDTYNVSNRWNDSVLSFVMSQYLYSLELRSFHPCQPHVIYHLSILHDHMILNNF